MPAQAKDEYSVVVGVGIWWDMVGHGGARLQGRDSEGLIHSGAASLPPKIIRQVLSVAASGICLSKTVLAMSVSTVKSDSEQRRR